jgi:hypothetical protein
LLLTIVLRPDPLGACVLGLAMKYLPEKRKDPGRDRPRPRCLTTDRGTVARVVDASRRQADAPV